MLPKKEAIVFMFFLFTAVFCRVDKSDSDSDDSDVVVDKCLEKNHNTLVNSKCLDVASLWIKLLASEVTSPELYNYFHLTTCKGLEVIKACVEAEGGYCNDQDQFGPKIIKLFDVLCSNDHEFQNAFDLLVSIKEPQDEEYDEFSEYYRQCVKEELGIDIDEDDDFFDKVVVPTVEKYAKVGYKCFSKSVKKFTPHLLEKAQHFALLYYKVLGFNIGPVEDYVLEK